MSLMVPVKSRTSNGWMFFTPFTVELWIASLAIFISIIFIVWLLERRFNTPEFSGTWKDQLGNVLCVTFSSLSSAQSEGIHRKYTRVVVVVWLFVMLIVTQSYIANLSSMLTISRLVPNNVDSLKTSEAEVGCYGNSIVRGYLENVLHFKKDKIRDDIATQSRYLKCGNISATFLEAPYANVVVKQYCDQFTLSGPTYKFGGLGFVFQKGSPMVGNFSKAILTLMEDGTMKKLEDEYFPTSSDCSSFQNTKDNGRRLSLQNFWGLYIFYIAISTICLLLCIIRSLNDQQHIHEHFKKAKSLQLV